MIRHARRDRHSARPRFRLDALEARLLCSIGDAPGTTPAAVVAGAGGATLEVVATDPAAGGAVHASPTTLTLTFNEPIQAATLGPDVQLGRLAADGTVTPVRAPIREALDATRTRLIVALPAGSLAPGAYRIALSGSSLLTGDDGAATDPGAPPLADFTVLADAPRGPSLADAIDLGVPGTTPLAVGGSLDLTAQPGGARLYKVILPAGQTWRLGAEVTTVGVGLDSALTLFDAAGTPLASDVQGRSGPSGDPYLFAGLAPGTYYLGVSGAGNVPGTPGGYDPVAATAGTTPPAGPGGSYRLRVVADVIDRPTTVQAVSLNHADPLSATPTGLTIQFSGALRLESPDGRRIGPIEDGLTVIDDSGRTWPLMTSAVADGGSYLSFLFRDVPAPGHYEVRLAPVGGLADLAGRAPVAPGEPAGVLAAFDIAPEAAAKSPDDLGALAPSIVRAGVSRAFDLAPGASASLRFVVESAGLYILQAEHDGGPLAIRLATDGGATEAIDPGAAGSSRSSPHYLEPGVYYLGLAAAGDQAAHARITLRVDTQSELLLPNGVGQGSALDLRLIAPAAPGPIGPIGPIGPAGPPTTTTAPTRDASTATAGGSGPLLTFGGEAVGRPMPGADHIAPAGAGVGDSPALASVGTGLLQGIDYGIAPPAGRASGIAPGADRGQGDAGAGPSLDGSIVAVVTPDAATPAGGAAGSTALAEAEGPGWIERLRRTLADLEPVRVPDDLVADVGTATLRAEAGAEAEPDDARAEIQVEQAGIGSNLGMGLAAVLAAHCIRLIRRRQKGRRGAGPRLAMSSRATGARRLA